MIHSSKKTKKIWIPIIQRRGESLLMTSYLMTAYQDQYHQEILLLPRGIHDTKYLKGIVIIEANDFGAFESSIAARLTPEYLAFFISRCRHEADSLLYTAHKIRSKMPYNTLTNTELLLLFTTYSSNVIRLMPFLFGIVTMEGVLQKELKKKFITHCQQYNIKADTESYLNSLIFPQKKNIPSLAISELYELAADVHSNSSLRKLFDTEPAIVLPQLKKKFPAFMSKFDTYLRRYDFMNMEYYVGRPLTSEELFERIREVIKDAKNRLVAIKHDRKKIQIEFKQACDKLKLTLKLRSFINSVQTIHYLRQYRADALFKAGRDVVELMMTIAGHLKIDYDALITLTWSEISDSLIKGQLIVNSESIAARQVDYGILLIDGKCSFITDDILAKELAALPSEEQELKEIRGTIAFHGKYCGPVVIVTTSEEISKVKSGDVLVSPMTDPYYIPAMTRASAIITDEGGILSHAAIVSRELGIPCVIGTKYATKILKDGDLVEVDADKGIVRILL